MEEFQSILENREFFLTVHAGYGGILQAFNL